MSEDNPHQIGIGDLDPEQDGLFEADWKKLWEGMPEFISEDKNPASSLKVHFHTEDDEIAFRKLMREHMGLEGPLKTDRQSFWFPVPKGGQDYFSDSKAPRVVVEPNRYPVYVITKGRADTPLTIDSLEQLGIPHYVVIEPQEREAYEPVVGEAGTILELPFANLGQGSIPARNHCWDHAKANGHRRHWILDDNMRGFFRLNRNVKRQIIDSNPFTPMEEFVDRYQNLVIAGPHYQWFIQSRTKTTPFLLNTRVYSCILIDNELRDADGNEIRWRGRYNEDTDLCLRALKAGHVTCLFRAFLTGKAPSMAMKGGNTDELYQRDHEDKERDGRYQMARSLVDQHPDCVRVVEKWGRYQHEVDYHLFRHNRLIPVGEVPPEEPAREEPPEDEPIPKIEGQIGFDITVPAPPSTAYEVDVTVKREDAA